MYFTDFLVAMRLLIPPRDNSCGQGFQFHLQASLPKDFLFGWRPKDVYPNCKSQLTHFKFRKPTVTAPSFTYETNTRMRNYQT